METIVKTLGRVRVMPLTEDFNEKKKQKQKQHDYYFQNLTCHTLETCRYSFTIYTNFRSHLDLANVHQS